MNAFAASSNVATGDEPENKKHIDYLNKSSINKPYLVS
jgi:hypothetical protein